MKHQITPDQINNIGRMLLSKDPKDASLALEILKSRDKNDKQTEECFDKIKYALIEDPFIFNSKFDQYVVRYKDKYIKLVTKGVWKTKQGASGAITRYIEYNKGNERLTSLIESFGSIRKLKEFLIKNKVIEIIKIGDETPNNT